MFKELTVTLICLVTISLAARVPHGEPVKKQAVYTGYVPPYNVYQDPHYYGAAHPQNQVGVIPQGQTVQTGSGSAGTTGSSVKQSYVPQKSTAYSPVINSVPTQYPYPFKQYYPQIYPQSSHYPTVPSVFYIPSQGRFPSTVNEGTTSSEQGVSAGSPGSMGSSTGSWFGSNWNQNLPNWPSVPQVPQLPQAPSTFPQFPSNFPQYPTNFPQFPSQYPQFPANFPGGLPNFPGNAPASPVPTGAAPTGSPGSEAATGATTNSEGHSVVVVSARRPEKIEYADSNVEGVKNDADKVATDFPPQQYYILGQPQYLVQSGAQSPVGKDPVQLDGASKGAISSFLFQSQPAVAQQTPVHQFPHIPQNKIFSAQEFQELLQQVQAANKKLLDTNNLAPQFYIQQGVPQQGIVQQVGSSQNVPQQPQDVPAQQYLYQSVQPVAPVQQPYLQFTPQQQQLFVPQFSSLPQKPYAEVSNVPGASLAYQRFILENQKPIKSSAVGGQNVEGTSPVSGAGPAPISIPSSVSSSSVSSNESTSSPEPSNNAENDSAGNTSDSYTKSETNEIPVNDDVSQNSTPLSANDGPAVPIKVARPNDNVLNGDENRSSERQNIEFGTRLNSIRPNNAQV